MKMKIDEEFKREFIEWRRNERYRMVKREERYNKMKRNEE